MNKTSSNSNIINYFELEEGSEVLHLVIQNNFNESNLQFTSHATCHQNSIFNQLIFNCSDVSLRNHHYANLIGEHSEANLKGIFLITFLSFSSGCAAFNNESPGISSTNSSPP